MILTEELLRTVHDLGPMFPSLTQAELEQKNSPMYGRVVRNYWIDTYLRMSPNPESKNVHYRDSSNLMFCRDHYNYANGFCDHRSHLWPEGGTEVWWIKGIMPTLKGDTPLIKIDENAKDFLQFLADRGLVALIQLRDEQPNADEEDWMRELAAPIGELWNSKYSTERWGGAGWEAYRDHMLGAGTFDFARFHAENDCPMCSTVELAVPDPKIWLDKAKKQFKDVVELGKEPAKVSTKRRTIAYDDLLARTMQYNDARMQGEVRFTNANTTAWNRGEHVG